MKALLLTQYQEMQVTDVDEPEVGPDDVLVQVEACGICGSDIHGYDGSTGRRIPPLVMGHEASGIVVETGQSVDDLPVGTRVTFDSMVSCGRCHFCRRGDANLCEDRMVLGVSCGDYRRHGAFAERIPPLGTKVHMILVPRKTPQKADDAPIARPRQESKKPARDP